MAQHGTDGEILEQAAAWLEAGQRCALVTVVKTWGSSPRPVGSLMLMRPDGRHRGSVSGGCVEDDLIARYGRGELAEGLPTLVDYGVDREQAARFGLPCGGRLELLVEQLDSAAPVRGLLQALAEHRLMARRVCFKTGEVSLHPATPDAEFLYSGDALEKVFGPRWELLLIGAGHLSEYVARMALMLGYRVMVCDPREQYAEGWNVPEVELVRDMPDDAVQAHARHPRCLVVALTHDPKLDDLALLDALQSPAFYVGALGSARSSEKRRERLRSLGLSEDALQRLHAPVGLDIGSHTPPEIAVSILAGITAERNSARRRARRAASAA
jgi:xanthine dehydrogenase accessory factor